MTTRVLTARAIVAFMTLDIIESRIFEVFDHIQVMNNILVDFGPSKRSF